MNAPTGVLTFLFTDIEGSTRRWEADPSAMQVALAAHDATLTTAVADHRGQVFKHTGDGVCAVFRSPADAVQAAINAQRLLELPVRMGIATGEAQHRGDDYFGTALNRAARVMAAGHGGQILLDGATAALLGEIELIGFGPRRLRDLAKAVELHQVRAEGLAVDFPPLRAVEPAPGNLRPPTTSFVGRDTELADVMGALSTHRLVTLTGVGGVGKTRLAQEIGTRISPAFPDGVWDIELAAVTDPTALPDAVAATLGITQQPGLTVAQSVARAAAGRDWLLIFDNCEHVLDAAAALIDAILSASQTARVLATSREGLRCPDEQLWPVPALDTGSDSAAVQLFLDRARAVSPETSWAADESTAAQEICRRLDGIPLAIELAASRLQAMTVSELRDRLDDRFRLLVGARRGLERHQTLRHAVQWSYDLLSDDEKSLLSTCSVFTGGFDLAAASAVADIDDLTALDILDALVRKSLLVADRTSPRTRYALLETIRQFAEEQLVASGAAERVRAAHAHYFAAREDAVIRLWDSPRQREAYAWFDAELPNLRSAFRWATDRGDLDTAAPIAVYASFLGTHYGQYEPIGWAEELVDPARAADHPRLAQLLAGAAECNATGRIEAYRTYALAADAAMDTGRYDEVRVEMAMTVAIGYLAIGEAQPCISLCRKIIQRRGAHPHALTCLSLALKFARADAEAATITRELTARPRSDNPNWTCYTLLSFAYVHLQDDPVAAYEGLRQALTIARDSGNRQLESPITLVLSRLAIVRGEFAAALDYLTETIRYRYHSGSLLYQRIPLSLLAALLCRLGRPEPAATVSGFAGLPAGHTAFPEIEATVAGLREGLGEPAYESHVHVGAGMNAADITTYALDQIDRVRADLAGPR